MKQTVCDLCGCPITKYEKSDRYKYKIKKYEDISNTGELACWVWKKLDVHWDCMLEFVKRTHETKYRPQDFPNIKYVNYKPPIGNLDDDDV